MSLISVKEIAQTYNQKTLFKDVSFDLNKKEHIGLVGANGQGKSTLMKILAKKIEPSLGNVLWSKSAKIGYMDQHLDLGIDINVLDFLQKAYLNLYISEKRMVEIYEISPDDISEQEHEKLMNEAGKIQDLLIYNDFYELDHKIKKVGDGLGVKEIGYDKLVNNLSGGQRTKLLLAKLLLEEPDVLLLDEPTNYLDENHIDWLKQYLLQYKNTFILISHDVPFMNSLVDIIYHIENLNVKRYSGNYDFFINAYNLNQEKLQSAAGKQEKQMAKLQKFIDKNKARASSSSMAQSRQKTLNKIVKIEVTKNNIKHNFDFKYSRAPSKIILEAKDLVLGYDRALTAPLNLQIKQGDKIAIIGTNGLGKTTLLKSLINTIKPFSGDIELGQYLSIGYFEQETNFADISCIDYVWNAFDCKEKTHQLIRGALARCGLTKTHIDSKLKQLSGGEQAKAKLCVLMNNKSNLLILDEPTNHLDQNSKRELKIALQKYEGTIILVSHEPEFYKDIVTEIWNGENWAIRN